MANETGQAVAAGTPDAPQGAPAAQNGAELTQAQQYKLDMQKAQAKAQADKRAAVLAKVQADAASYKTELRGTWLMFEERKTLSPAMVVAERFQGEGDDLKLILTLYVFSPFTAQPYRTELSY